MKTVGIVVDDYKLDKFKKELTEKGFTKYTTHPFVKGTTTIKVEEVSEEKVLDLARLCKRLEYHFKHSN